MKEFLWAKKNRVNDMPMWLPLTVHLEDTMKVCGFLWEHWLSDSSRDFIVNSIKSDAYDKYELAKNICKFIGSVHDFGKATANFQVKKSFFMDYELDQLILENLKANGFKDIDKYAAKKIENLNHAYAGQNLLLKHGLNFTLANVIGGHHGKPFYKDYKSNINAFRSSYYQIDDINSQEFKIWDKIHKDILNDSLTKSGFKSISDLPLISQPGQVILSGLLIMADWITSNEYYFPLIEIGETKIDPSRAEKAFTKWMNDKIQNWQAQSYYDDMYKDRFGFNDGPRKEQELVANIVDNIDDPGIMIFEAPMGIGKTEVALTAVEQLANSEGLTGMFFGLPTQATSNGIFSRVKDWINNTEDGKSIRLIHGKAALNDEFSKLPKSRNMYEEDQIGINQWFSSRKLSILDDFTVGTVDQVLLMALKQKHLMLRHLGFSNKVVVIDEVHAYDAYMSIYLYQALRWMGAYSIPVIILSATLPIKKRNKLLESYMVGCGYKFTRLEKPAGFENKESYPLLTYNDGLNINQFDNFEKKDGKDFKIIKKSKEDSHDIVNIIKKLACDGGIIGIVLNTVKKAQEFAKICIDEFGQENVSLLHSSFIATDRYQKEKELIDTIGKNGDRPKFKIIIGTQVIEQSLDIDFDLLITDLAPMDLILQRMGRLHRHRRNDRPEKLKLPKVIILNCSGYDFDEGSAHVYDPFILFRTEYYLPDKINLPNDISHLVQLVYKDNDLKLEDKDNEVYKEYKIKSENNIKLKEDKAKTFRLDKPKINRISEDKNISKWIDNPNLESEKSDTKAFAQVRDGSDTIEVIALKEYENGYGFFENSQNLDPNDDKTAMNMAKHTINLPSYLYYGNSIDEVVRYLEKYYIENLSDWDKQGWLKGSLGIIFDEDNEFKIFDKILKYDVDYGLTIIKEVDDE